MTRYRLKKDTPLEPAGTIYELIMQGGERWMSSEKYNYYRVDSISNFSDWFEEIPDGQADDKLNDPLPRYENLIRRIKIYKATAESSEYRHRITLNACGGAKAALLDYAKWMSQVTKRVKDDGLEAVINEVALRIEAPLDAHTFEVALRATAGCALRMIDEIDDANDIADLERTAEEARWDS